jgi:hypothetical protein
MKQITFLLLAVLSMTSVFGQIDQHGNPVFNNELISEETLENFELTSSYYNIKDNISKKESSVYVSDNPTVDDYLKFARDLPSNFFIIHKGQNVIIAIVLLQRNDGDKTALTYNIVNPNSGESMEVPCNVFGEITEKRVDELLKLKIDSTAKILDMPGGKSFLFNGIAYKIQPYDELKAEVIELANQLISGGEEIKDPVEYIKKETIGGKLDFNKVLENEKQSFFVYDGIAYNKKDFAIYLWGKKVKMIGIKSSKKAILLWEEINKRTLTEPEKKALNSGFNSKTE